MDRNNSTMVVSRPRQFARPGNAQALMPAPSSPMVLKVLLQSILDLNQRMDALAVRQAQPPVVRQVETSPPEKKRRKILDRDKLRDIFD